MTLKTRFQQAALFRYFCEEVQPCFMKQILWIIFPLLFNALLLKGQSFPLESLTIEDGLSQGMIYDVLGTRDGFLWLATKDGLNRYDGYNFKVWNNDPYNPYSLADNSISALFEDSRGWLWVGCESKGLNLFDRKTERFYHFSFPIVYNRGEITLFDIRQIIEDTDGNIWVAIRGTGVFRIEIPKTWSKALPDTPELSALTTITGIDFSKVINADKKPFEQYRCLLQVSDGRLLVGTSKALYSIDNRTLSVSTYKDMSSFSNGCWTLHATKDGTIWGAGDTGIFRNQHGKWEHFDLKLKSTDVIETNPALKISQDGQIWIFFGNHVWALSDQEIPKAGEPDYVIDNEGNTLTVDEQGNVWLGTLGYGLRKITPSKAMFNTMLEGTSMWGMWQNQKGELFCKLFNKIVRFDPVTRQLSDQQAFPDALPQQNDMFIEPSGNFWLLCGLREGTINVSQLRYYRADESLIKAYDINLDRYPYARLLRTKDGIVWVTGTSGQLLRLDPATGHISNFDFGTVFGNNAAAVLAFAMVEDGNGIMWIGTQLGLVKLLRNGNKVDFQLFKANDQRPNSLNNNSIACLLPDPEAPDKTLWIGTKGGGINRLDLPGETFSYITTDEGLPNNVVYGILPDDEGNLWCSTNRGLAKLTFQPNAPLQVMPFTARDGLQSNEFNTQAFFKAPNGELIFGGVNGINRFLPKALKFNQKAPQVYLIGLEVNYKPVRFWASEGHLKVPLQYAQKLEFDYAQNNLSFEFSAMDFTDPSKNQYSYQLLPIEKEWVSARKDHFAHYTHLAPGHYVFRVRGSNSDGTWNETPVEIEVIIHPPWWQSNLAYVLYALAIIAAVWQIYRFQIRRVQLQQQLAYEHRETERVRALDEMKTNFFSNITHEFRTPITLIIEPLRQILQNPIKANWLSKVRLAEGNSRKLLQLVNQLLDLAKLESGAMKADYRTARGGELLRPVVKSFAVAADSKGVSLTFSAPEEEPFSEFDQDKLEKIAANLLSNALKFTPAGGSIEASVAYPKANSGHENYLLFTVRDTGKGIAPQDLAKVFDRFYQAADAPAQGQAGTGIGLALSRELAELMGGKIEVESRVGEGATFRLKLPLRKVGLNSKATENQAAVAEIVSGFALSETIVEVAHQHDDVHADHDRQASRPLLLLAEDNDELRAFLYQTLYDRFEVLQASNGAIAIDLARQHVPDIVVSDLVMPQLDGIEFLDALKKDVVTSHIPFVLLTAKTALESRLKGLQHGADAYLNKPFNTEELFAWLDNLLESRRHLQEKFAKSSFTANGAPPEVLTAQSITGPSAPEKMLRTLDRQFLEKLRDIVETELENDRINADDLAQRMAMSRSQLHRKLTAITGQSTSEFVRNHRLDRAIELLRAGEGNVSEIAWRVGFANAKHFSTSFKERFGMSPSEV